MLPRLNRKAMGDCCLSLTRIVYYDVNSDLLLALVPQLQ